MKLLRKTMKKLFKSSVPQGKVETGPIFERAFYRDITDARINHLKSMNLDIKGKSVVDVGCGIGHFSTLFTDMGCDLLCIDGRSENIEELKKRFPSVVSAVVDVESEELLSLGKFDIVFCYGLLYHLTNPLSFIQKVGHICKEMIILETCLMDAEDPVLQLVREDQDNPTQSLHPNGCRPSPAFVIESMKLAGFKHVYVPTKLPNHPQFKYSLNNDYQHIKKKNLIRGIYIASRKQIANQHIEPY